LVRKNADNKFYTLNYGKVQDITFDNVEKRPLFHFFPGSSNMNITIPGDNYPTTDVSQLFKDKKQEATVGKDYTPEQIVAVAEDKGVGAISFSAVEPFMYFEFAYKVAKLSHRSNIKNIFVTNGFVTEDAVKKIAKFLDAVVVNLKASVDPEFYSKFLDVNDTSPIFSSLKQFKKQRLHIEITDTIIPQVGDNMDQCKKVAEWINAEIGSEIPFHVVQFHYDTKLAEVPLTPVATLEKCIDVVNNAGIRYVYIGGLPKHELQSTICYNCREPLVIREGTKVKKVHLSKDRCPNCGLRINMIVE
jgi:pyruvate formate lyase activating enzyme